MQKISFYVALLAVVFFTAMISVIVLGGSLWIG